MNETTKTLTFVGIALLGALLAYASRPASVADAAKADDASSEFFAEFKDPLAAKSLEIIEWDEAKAEPKQFRVAQVNGRWAIPSKLNYPADADRQLAEAAASVIDLKKLGMVSEERADHEMYGVVDPMDSKAGMTGIGKKVILEDAGGKKLAQLIIGLPVKDKPDLRYVRLPSQDAVYVAKLSPEKLTTRFQDWIEPDLLKLNSWDITEVKYDNYSIDEVNRRIVEGDKLALTYNDKDAKWNMEGLAPNEELNAQKLNDMKVALDDLKIVDVRRKPAGLGRDLRTSEGLTIDEETFLSLASRGYIISQGQLYSNEGEVVVELKDGVTYVLRFGEIAADTEEAKPDEGAEQPAEGEQPKGSNRYLFVTAQFDKSAIPAPELQPVPGAPAEPAAPPTAEGQPAAENKEGEKQAGEPAEPQQAERQKIEQENKRKQDEYDSKVKKGEEQVQTLNNRFADWYYVISDDVYRKIKLTRADVVQPKKPADGTAPAGTDAAPPTTEGGLDEFNEIKDQGLGTPEN
ncbi:MAG: DUF4340 domain-containing protein [Pirellulales bacterium]|nr:DUF4340 domain-containing protein [Pirellulales bacterium]